MKYYSFLLLWFCFFGPGVNLEAQVRNRPAESGYEDLFDRISLKGWKGDPALWYVKDSLLIGEIKPGKELQRNSFIIWQGGRVKDFELIVEYKVSANGNSGFNYRSEEVSGQPFVMRGYQADLDGAKKYTGQNYEELGRKILAFPGQKVRLPPVKSAIADFAKKNIWTASELLSELGNADSLRLIIKDNDWNELRILARGNRLQHFINGVLMSDVTDDDVQNRKMDGLLGFQVHVGPPMTFAVRSIRLKRF